MFPDAKSSNHSSLPTPFRKRKKCTDPKEVPLTVLADTSGHACMFHDCKKTVIVENPETDTNVNFRIGVKRQQSKGRSTHEVMSFVACCSHSHLMKKRKIKRKVSFQQNSHMKNLLGTLMQIMGRSINASLSKLNCTTTD